MTARVRFARRTVRFARPAPRGRRADGEPSRRMFEFTGGGVAALDFDMDGYADVCFTQGTRWPPGSARGDSGDRLYRNEGGQRFADVSAAARLVEGGFGQGVAAGDFDSDGFPDLYVANIGRNQLWRNNGDGTFRDVTEEAGLEGDEWTTSCVLADLDGDGLADLYDVNYVTAPDVYDRVCRHDDGSAKLCMPFDFDDQPDRFWKNDGNGRFSDGTAGVFDAVPQGKGLGAAVWSPDGDGRLALLVANDTTPNFLFVRDSDAGPFRLRDRAAAAGLAFNADGKATGCMGVAIGDADADGRQDLLITNFLAEPNTLYQARSGDVFEDRTRELGLHAPSLDVLGFGTQFFDADLDGRLELFVANGHVDDLRRSGRPWRMHPQLFHWNGRRFVELNGADLGEYFARRWLGRAAARLDWNRDGRDDFVVGHLGDPYALLTNTTAAPGRFLSLRLFGVDSNRDAVGTTVEVRMDGRTLVRQITAGDGYQATNERRVLFGLGADEHAAELIVRWPSGLTQRFENVPADAEVWLVEGREISQAPRARPANAALR